MPEERIYRRQVGTRPAAPMPLSQPEDFGAGLARQVQQTAGELHRQNLENYSAQRARTRDAEMSEAFERVTGQQAFISEQLTEARNNAQPGADGHLAEVEALLGEDKWQPVFEGITEQSVQDWARRQMIDFAGRTRLREQDFTSARQIEKTVTDAQTALDRLVNASAHSADPNVWTGALELWRDYVGNLTGVDGNKLDQMYRGGVSAIDMGKARNWIASDPELLVSALDAGQFDDSLSPNEIRQLRGEASTAIRTREVAAAREVAQQQAALNESIQTLLERDKNGEVIPDADFAAAEAAAAATGDTSRAAAITGIRTDNAVTRVWGPGNATPLQRQQRMAELASIPQDKRTAEQSRELASLVEKAPSWDAAFERDPAGSLAVSGGIPPLNFSDPASLSRRASWRRRQTAVTGRNVPPLTRAEAAPLAEMKEGGKEAEVLNALDGFADPFDRLDAAQAIDADDKLFQRMAVMPKPLRGMVRQGAQALDVNPKLLTPENDNSDGAVRMGKWENRLAFALREIDPQDADAVRQTARLLLASVLSKQPGAKIDNLAEVTFSRAVQMALGREPRGDTHVGGLALWGGETPFIVADGYNAAGVRNALVRDRAAMDKEGLGPVNPDGTPASFSHAYPVWLGGRRYRWETAGGNPLRDSHGQVFISDLAR